MSLIPHQGERVGLVTAVAKTMSGNRCYADGSQLYFYFQNSSMNHKN